MTKGVRTVWERLEPRARSDTMEDALRAPVRDPMWMLSRQWQVSEFEGEDAGSPVQVDVDIAEDTLSRVDMRGGGRGEDWSPAGPFDYEGGPLEALVERESVMTDDDPPHQLRAEAGQEFLRTLADAGYGSYAADDFSEDLHLEDPGEALPASDRRYVELLSGRALDGAEIARAIRSAVDNIDDVVAGEADSWSGVTASKLPVPTGQSRTDAFDRAAETFYGWYVNLYDEPTTDTGSAWDPTRLEYRFAISTGAGETETVFEVPEYRGGHLDWHAFSAAGADESLAPPDTGLDRVRSGGGSTAVDEADLLQQPSVEALEGTAGDVTDRDLDLSTVDFSSLSVPTLHRSKSVVPTKISFPGMPAARWWEFEDGNVDIPKVTDDGAGLARLLLVEFATQYGNDWFRIDLDVPVGTLSRLTDLTVTDSFGISETAEPAMDEDWQLFMHDLPGHEEPGLLLPPTLSNSRTGDPVEKVVFARDEMANLAFAIEQTVESPTGRPIDRTEFRQPKLVVDRVSADRNPGDEYLELANPGEDRLVVDGYTIEAERDGSTSTVYTFDDRTLEAGETLRLATGTNPEADVSAGLSASAWTDAEAVRIVDDSGQLTAKKLLARPSDALADYRLSTDVPEYWFPFTPEQGWNFRLERALLLDASTLGLPVDRIPRPLGEILRPEDELLPPGEDTYQIFDEEIPRGGREVTRRYQHARWIDGQAHLWSSRETHIGDTQLSSGLRFDVLEERGPSG